MRTIALIAFEMELELALELELELALSTMKEMHQSCIYHSGQPICHHPLFSHLPSLSISFYVGVEVGDGRFWKCVE